MAMFTSLQVKLCEVIEEEIRLEIEKAADKILAEAKKELDEKIVHIVSRTALAVSRYIQVQEYANKVVIEVKIDGRADGL
jgi:hypothetical protein